ncbi:CheR family methyltransferase [Methylobrevis pamukkalensis]|uniref:Chemotaxis protein methyltransferase Cher2 n=1 Tax=Methylobrevis pamukkalensis TaxID=1439726 RepID=A0A1E3H8S8_9HYPH|nr:CheR family methyltransferase [Methylobrevis pamukkalensis]ODN71901.1 Chemotaxis protein methyltransferase Cher2 [Methylobrevis pamukkalensis]
MSEVATASPTETIELELLLEAIHRRYHYDFRSYSRASVRRRADLARERLGCATLSALQERILHEPKLLPVLIDCMTVQVSEMFRDPDYFRALREKVIPHLRTFPSLKVWVAGCSNGEELYSLAILFREEGLEQRTMFYATEINPTALAKAEAGIYDLDRIPLFTANHQKSGGKSSLSDYYTAAYGAAVFDKSLRARTVFAEHSLASDAVFSEVHLVSCRNVLIYFDAELQDRAIALFSGSLARGGFLGLGLNESLRFRTGFDAYVPFAEPERIWRRAADRTPTREAGHAV